MKLFKKRDSLLLELFKTLFGQNTAPIESPVATLRKEGYVILHESKTLNVVVSRALFLKYSKLGMLSTRELMDSLDDLGLEAETRMYMHCSVIFIREK